MREVCEEFRKRKLREGLRRRDLLPNFDEPILIFFLKDSCFYCSMVWSRIMEINSSIEVWKINVKDGFSNLYEPKVFPTVMLLGHSERKMTLLEGNVSRVQIEKLLLLHE